jgi:hypothetical protein
VGECSVVKSIEPVPNQCLQLAPTSTYEAEALPI